MEDTWYKVERQTPRNGHWHTEYDGASKDEARFALWNAVQAHPGMPFRVSERSDAEVHRPSALFPEGRTIFYEGDDPTGFVEQIKAEFGFDPSADEGWGVPISHGGERWTMYRFDCPAAHLDEIYGSGRWPMGS